MTGEGITTEVLEYLKKEGSTNTFKMARTMGMERNMLLKIIGKLEKKDAVKLERGKVLFLKFPAKEKVVKVISPLPEQKRIEKAVIRKPVQPKEVLLLQTENEQLQRKVVQLRETMQELERKASLAPKIITKTITKTIIKRVPVIKTVIKKVPITKTVIRKISVPTPPAETKLWERLKTHSEQFKVSGFKLFENIKQLKEPEFVTPF